MVNVFHCPLIFFDSMISCYYMILTGIWFTLVILWMTGKFWCLRLIILHQYYWKAANTMHIWLWILCYLRFYLRQNDSRASWCGLNLGNCTACSPCSACSYSSSAFSSPSSFFPPAAVSGAVLVIMQWCPELNCTLGLVFSMIKFSVIIYSHNYHCCKNR